MSDDTDFKNIGKTGSVFWVIMIIYTLITFLYLSINSAIRTSSTLGAIIGVTFIVMILISLYYSGKSLVEEEKDFTTSTLGFFGGFILIFIIAYTSKIILLLNKQSLMSLLTSQLTPTEDFRLNVINVPIAEEFFWLVTIPMFVVLILNAISNAKKFSWAGNKWVQIITVIIVSGSSFALFHVGQIGEGHWNKITLGFLISAFIFRSLLLIFASEPGEKIIKTADIATSFALGVHIGNNWSTYVFGYQGVAGIGWAGTFRLLTGDFWGILFLGILIVFGGIAIYRVGSIVKEKWF